MKNLLNLNGAQLLSKNEQQSIHGGKAAIECSLSANSETDWCCHFGCV
jgi:hypothetical protein